MAKHNHPSHLTSYNLRTLVGGQASPPITSTIFAKEWYVSFASDGKQARLSCKEVRYDDGGAPWHPTEDRV